MLACEPTCRATACPPGRASIDDFSATGAPCRPVPPRPPASTCRNPGTCAGKAPAAPSCWISSCSARNAEPGATILLAAGAAARLGPVKLSYHLIGPFRREIPLALSENSTDADSSTSCTTATRCSHAICRPPGSMPGPLDSAPGTRRCQPLNRWWWGEDDMTVDWRHNLQVLQDKFDQPQILHLPGARHHLVNEHEDIRRRYFAFLSERLR